MVLKISGYTILLCSWKQNAVSDSWLGLASYFQLRTKLISSYQVKATGRFIGINIHHLRLSADTYSMVHIFSQFFLTIISLYRSILRSPTFILYSSRFYQRSLFTIQFNYHHQQSLITKWCRHKNPIPNLHG